MARKRRKRMGCSVVRTKSGKLSIRWRWVPPDGRLRHMSVTTALDDTPENRKRLDNKRAEIGAQLRQGTFRYEDHFEVPRGWWEPPSPNQPTGMVAGAFDLWVADRELRRVRASRIRNYRSDGRYILERMGHLPLTALADGAVVKDFQSWLISRAGKAGTGLSEKTAANVIRGTLRAFMRDAGLSLAALDALTWERYVPARRKDPLTEEERDLVLAWLAENATPEERLFWRIAFETGARHSEILGLDAGDFDRRTHSLHVRQGRYEGRSAPPKTRGAERPIMLSRETARLVRGLIGIRKPDAPLFQAMTYKRIQPSWRRALAGAGVRYRPPYQTKHTYATAALLEGVPPAVVARQLGIASSTLDKHYSGIIERVMNPDSAPVVRRRTTGRARNAEK